MSWQSYLRHSWLTRNALSCSLWPLSLLYGALFQWRKKLALEKQTSHSPLNARVIVVGNVVAGGVGKTPIVIAIIQHFQRQGIHVGVISRGYGRKIDSIQEVWVQSHAKDVGDEPLLIKSKSDAPVFVGRERFKVAKALLEKYPETQIIISDDGLQHWKLARDIEICVFDERHTGNGWLLPAGPLREPWPREKLAPFYFEVQSCATAQNETSLSRWRILRTLSHEAINAQGKSVKLNTFSHAQAIAAIAKPEVFFKELEDRGIQLDQTWALADHDDLTQIPPFDTAKPLLCTEKDAIKIWKIYPQALAVPLICELPQEFTHQIDLALTELARTPV
jgi:tetraacyldisaccharide 4'-kinase